MGFLVVFVFWVVGWLVGFWIFSGGGGVLVVGEMSGLYRICQNRNSMISFLLFSVVRRAAKMS